MLRRISPIHQQGRVSREQAELMQSLQEAQTALTHANLSFDALSDPELVDVTVLCMRIYVAGIWAMGAQTACQQSFVAIGQAKISIFLALLRKIILLIPLALILPLFMGTYGVFTAEPIADLGAATTTSIMFAIFFKRFLQKKANEAIPADAQ